MGAMASPSALPPPETSAGRTGRLVAYFTVQLLDPPELRDRAQALLGADHYLGGVQAVGEPLPYAVTDAQGDWLAVLIFATVAWPLRLRKAPMTFCRFNCADFCQGRLASATPGQGDRLAR